MAKCHKDSKVCAFASIAKIRLLHTIGWRDIFAIETSIICNLFKIYSSIIKDIFFN